MINVQNFTHLLRHLGFAEIKKDFFSKQIKQANEVAFELSVDCNTQQINYPESAGLKVHQRQTCNFSASENAVVFECVHRLLSKGYKPEHIELEPEWKLGHGGKSGRADILVRNQQGTALLIIECKTAGREFLKAWENTQEDGAQLFSYVEQEKATQFICLYASAFDDKDSFTLKTSQRIISVKDNAKILEDMPNAASFGAATNVTERFKAWKDTYKQEYTETGIFEENIQAYQIGKNKYTLMHDTRPLESKDIKGKYHDFRTILRKHNVSRRENAFEVLVNLFVCKIVDELENPNDLKFYWKGIAYDNYYDLVDRLQLLYKTGMQQFLEQEIVYISNDDIENAFWPVKNQRSAVRDEIKKLFRQLKFFKGMDFEFIKVFNQNYFDKNAKILIEIIQMWQGYRLTGTSHHQFLGDMFEYFLDNGIKQSEGQFFTPVPICKFIISSLPLENLIEHSHEPLKAIDYACGSGHFLTEYASQLPKLLKKHKSTENTSDWNRCIYGIEKEDRLAKVAKVSAFMYGFNEIQILDADALVRHEHISEAGYDILMANPPFSVEDFLQTVPEDERSRYTLFGKISDLSNKNVQCFFLERAQQLLKPGAVMGVIVPTSILTNTDTMHIATRKVLLENFDFVAITELGGNTFGKTGTNTVVLFLRRKTERPTAALHFNNRVKDYFERWAEEIKTEGGEYVDLSGVQRYCAHIGVSFEHYQTLLNNKPTADLLSSEPFKDYRRAFDEANDTKKRVASKEFKSLSPDAQQNELTQLFTAFCREREQTKLFYYLLAAHNAGPVLLIKGPSDNKAQQQFLGYEWSGAKGQEGIRYLGGDSVKDIATPLFDPNNRDNAEKISYCVKQNFNNQPLQIPTDLHPYLTQAHLTDLLEFGRVEFDAVVSLNLESKIKINTIYPLEKLNAVVRIIRGVTYKKTDEANEKTSQIILTAESISLPFYFTPQKVTYLQDGVKLDSEKALRKNDIFMCFASGSKAHIGKSCFISENTNYYAGGFMGILRANLNCLPKFIFEMINHELISKQIKNLSSGSNINNLGSSIGEIKIPLPPLPIQQLIVAECEAVDIAVDEANRRIAQAKQQLKASFLQVQNDYFEQVKLGNSDLFDIFIGKRLLKNEVNENKKGIPIYSANVLQPFGYIDKELISDFSKDSILWGIDGDWMVNIIPAGNPFYPTDHCGVIRIKTGANINARYLALALEKEGQRVRFSRSNRAKTEAIKGLRIVLPTIEKQNEIASMAEKAEHVINAANVIIAAAPAQKQAILQKYL